MLGGRGYLTSSHLHTFIIFWFSYSAHLTALIQVNFFSIAQFLHFSLSIMLFCIRTFATCVLKIHCYLTFDTRGAVFVRSRRLWAMYILIYRISLAVDIDSRTVLHVCSMERVSSVKTCRENRYPGFEAKIEKIFVISLNYQMVDRKDRSKKTKRVKTWIQFLVSYI